MDPRLFGGFGTSWLEGPKLLQAGVDKFSHKRAKSHNSKNDEKLCKKCKVRQVRGKCRNKGCK